MDKLRTKLRVIYKVRRKLTDGSVAEYHYAWRGGPKIWDHSKPFEVHSVAYVGAYFAAITSRIEAEVTFQKVTKEYLVSAAFTKLGEPAQLDDRRNIAVPDGIEDVFGQVPIRAFDNRQFRGEILCWRNTLSEETGDTMLATLRRIISFAQNRNLIRGPNFPRIEEHTKPNRDPVIWTQAEIDQFVAGAPPYVGRVLVAAVETGLRPGELQLFSRKDIEKTIGGHDRIVLRTTKSLDRNFRVVPMTPPLARLIAEVPAEQERFLVTAHGKPFAQADMLVRLVSEWRDRLGIRRELRLYDARGTAVVRLMRAGCTLSELASHMGWSIEHAEAMLERYAALDPDLKEKPRRREPGDGKGKSET